MNGRPSNASKAQHGRRTGRRPGPSKTREQILVAARESFAKRGYDRTSLRGVAAAAGVDPALVRRFFGSKEGLLTAALMDALRTDDRLAEALRGDISTLGDRMIRYFLSVWEESRNRDVLVGMIRSACTNERGATLLRDYLSALILARVSEVLEPADAQLRASLVAASCVGLALARYVVKIEPLASASAEDIRVVFAPTLQRLLSGDLT
jgi:AcrR family transcriptional regulator